MSDEALGKPHLYFRGTCWFVALSRDPLAPVVAFEADLRRLRGAWRRIKEQCQDVHWAVLEAKQKTPLVRVL